MNIPKYDKSIGDADVKPKSIAIANQMLASAQDERSEIQMALTDYYQKLRLQRSELLEQSELLQNTADELLKAANQIDLFLDSKWGSQNNNPAEDNPFS